MIFLKIFLTIDILTIASFRIGVPACDLVFSKFYNTKPFLFDVHRTILATRIILNTHVHNIGPKIIEAMT